MASNYHPMWFLQRMLIFMLVILASCSSREAARNVILKGADEEEIPPSQLVLPIQISTENICEKLNSSIPENIITSKKLDKGIYVDVVRLGDIKLKAEDGILEFCVPLKVYVKRNRYSVWQIFTKKEEKLKQLTDFSAMLYVRTGLHVNKDYKVLTQCQIHELEWIDQPKINILNMNINVAQKVEQVIMANASEIEKVLDKTVHNKLNLKKAIEALWEKAHRPILINKKYRNIWLKARPTHISIDEIKIEKGQISTRAMIEFQAFAETDDYVGSVKNDLPILEFMLDTVSWSHITVAYSMSYEELTHNINTELTGVKLELEEYQVSIDHVHLLSTETNQLRIEVSLSGDIAGELSLSGVPKLNSGEELSFSDFEYDMSSSSSLVTLTDLFLHDDIRSRLKEKLKLNFGQFNVIASDTLENAIKKSNLGEKIDVKSSQILLKPKNLSIGREGIRITLEAFGKAQITLLKI